MSATTGSACRALRPVPDTLARCENNLLHILRAAILIPLCAAELLRRGVVAVYFSTPALTIADPMRVSLYDTSFQHGSRCDQLLRD